jgi:GTP-binding protein
LALPCVVIVGRPNVGKSTLFNVLVGSRRAIVGDEPGITRDRIRGEATHFGKKFELIDTGGMVPDDDQLIPAEIFKQARVALKQADQIIYVVDGRTEITGTDRELARLLIKTGRPVSLAVNKIDAPVREALAASFSELGIGDLFPVSAEHRIGIEELLDHVTRDFPRTADEEERPPAPRIRVAIIGRPNVGKSTLLNALVGAERAIVTPVAGTTRDAVDESVTRGGVEFVFVDTAGIRRKGKTKQMAEKLSVIMARKHLESADVALVVIDANEGVVGIDANIAGYAHEAGRPLILCLNKWDAVEKRDKRAFVQKARDALRYLEYAPIAFLSAKSGAGVDQLFGLIRKGYESASRRIPTAELNAYFKTLEADINLKIKYLTQAGVRPPTFVVFKDSVRPLHFSYERFLMNQLRERFDFRGTPIVIKSRSKKR